MRKLCPNCEELLKPTSNPEVGQCSGCGWSGHYWRATKEPRLPAAPPKLPYVSIDIETTGLDPETCQILEIGAVLGRLDEAHRPAVGYYRLVYHKIPRSRLRLGDERQPAEATCPVQQEPWSAGRSATPTRWPTTSRQWLKGCGLDPMHFTGRQELRQLRPAIPETASKIRAGGKLSHRTLDPAVLFWQSGR